MQAEKMSKKIEQARLDFPIFQCEEWRDLIYLDSAATSQKPSCVLDAEREFYTNANANAHRGAYALGDKATALFENARQKLANFVGLHDPSRLVFTRGSTESANIIAYAWQAWAEKKFPSKLTNGAGRILLSRKEHHSNFIPWQQLAIRRPLRLDFLPLRDDGAYDLDELHKNSAKYLRADTRIIALTHASNVLGHIEPIEEMLAIISKSPANSALIVVDGAQFAPHDALDFDKLEKQGVDAYFFSGHKMLAPMGTGCLLLAKKILSSNDENIPSLEPAYFGGSMVDLVKCEESSWAAMPQRFEAGTQNVAGAIALARACEYLQEFGLKNISDYTVSLTSKCLAGLREMPEYEIYGNKSLQRHPLISFNMKGVHPHDLSSFFDSRKIAMRAGHHCAQELMRFLGIKACARVSFYLYNNKADVEIFLKTAAEARKFFAKWRI